MKRYVFSLFLFSTMIIQAPPKGCPDLRALDARKRLQASLRERATQELQNTDPKIKKEAKATLGRLDVAAVDSQQGSVEYLKRVLARPNKVSSAERTVPFVVRQVAQDPQHREKVQVLLGDKPVSVREFNNLIKLADSAESV